MLDSESATKIESLGSMQIPAGAAELLPFREELAVLIEDLDAIVASVGYEKPPLRIHGQRMQFEFARPRAELGPRP